MEKNFDYIIVGGGLSGMMLAYLFSQSSLSKKKILIIEKNLTRRYVRDWSYWIDFVHPFEPVVYKKWKRMSVRFDNFYREENLKRYRFELIRSKDFFSFVSKKLQSLKNVLIVEGEVLSFQQNEKLTDVITTCGEYLASFVFDSVGIGTEKKEMKLLMKGFGWEVKSQKKIFDTRTVTFFDFCHSIDAKTPWFYYILPLSETTALIDLASFSNINSQRYEFDASASLKNYLQKTTSIDDLELKYFGFQKISLHPSRGRLDLCSQVIPIGLHAGLLKASTSYAFVNILRDCMQIVETVEKTNGNFIRKQTNGVFHFADKLLLLLLRKNPMIILEMFTRLFRLLDNFDQLFLFLDERLPIYQTFRIMIHSAPNKRSLFQLFFSAKKL